jgi:hypothetical protein
MSQRTTQRQWLTADYEAETGRQRSSAQTADAGGPLVSAASARRFWQIRTRVRKEDGDESGKSGENFGVPGGIPKAASTPRLFNAASPPEPSLICNSV